MDQNVWAMATVIFSYTGSPQVKILQKVFLRELLFLTRTVYAVLCTGWLLDVFMFIIFHYCSSMLVPCVCVQFNNNVIVMYGVWFTFNARL